MTTILTKTTVVYDPETKEIIGEFHAGTELALGEGAESYEGSLQAFIAENPDYQVNQF